MITKEVLDAAKEWGPRLHTGSNDQIDPVKLLIAVASVESSGGVRALASLHERAYCYGGKYHNDKVAGLSRIYGCCVHSSWGPWQILYVTASEHGYYGDPVELRKPSVSVPYVVAVMNHRMIEPVKLENIFDAWNSGNARDNNVPHEYIQKAMAAYQELT